MVPMFTCGLLRSNFSLAICFSAPQYKIEFLANPRTLELLLAACLLNDLLGQGRRQLGVMRQMHGERLAPLRAAAQIRGVTKHLRTPHFHANDLAARPILPALNRRTPGTHVSPNRRR